MAASEKASVKCEVALVGWLWAKFPNLYECLNPPIAEDLTQGVSVSLRSSKEVFARKPETGARTGSRPPRRPRTVKPPQLLQPLHNLQPESAVVVAAVGGGCGGAVAGCPDGVGAVEFDEGKCGFAGACQIPESGSLETILFHA